MLEPILSLSFSVCSNKGVYALLLGSEISRSAGIPTGWDIVLDFVRRVAKVYNENCEPDPEAWYRNKFGEEPNYSKLLNDLAKSPTERCQLLKNYFEPNEEDREKGLKVPTVAHKAIADMVANKYVKVIITTNFDRLLEKALEEVGITPIVISNDDSIKGAIPLTHAECTVIKINGDYIDTRIKNTPEELANYSEELNKLLDRVFDEFGLIVCGWSGEWDTALRSAIVRCASHRFTTYWTSRHEPVERAKELIQIRRAEVINIKDSDSFFSELSQQISVLNDFNRTHPLSTKAAVQRLKKYLSDSRYKIEIDDLLMQEADRVYEVMSKEDFSMSPSDYDEEFRNRVIRYENLIEKLQNLFIAGCYYGEKIHENSWIRCLEKITVYPNLKTYKELWFKLYYYPALLLLYSGGIASIAANNYETFAALCLKTSVFVRDKKSPLSLFLYDETYMSEEFKKIPKFQRCYTPLSSYLDEKLETYFKDYLPQKEKYRECFDKFEYLLALIVADHYHYIKKNVRVWGPSGCFSWRSSDSSINIIDEIELESNKSGNDWPLLKAGAFDCSLERFQDIKKKFDNIERNFY